MEETYKSISELEKLFKRTTNMKCRGIWKIGKNYKQNPDEMIETKSSRENSGTKTLIINGNGATLNDINKYSFLYIGEGYT